MKLPSFYAKLFALSLLLSCLLWQLFIPEVFARVFFEFGQRHVLIPIIFIPFLIAISYFSLHTFVLRAYKRLRATWTLSILIIIWYIISLILLEFISQATGNFGNTMNCLGTGCVTYIMTGYRTLSWIFLPIYWAAIIAVFKDQLKKELSNSSQKN
jgi:hypothetical protein